MTTLTAPSVSVKPSKAKKQKQRSLSFNSLTGILHVKVDGKETGYKLDKIDHQLGPSVRCYSVSKIITKPGEPDSYDVAVSDNGTEDACDCIAFSRWSKCRHVDALRCLLTLKKIT